MSRPGGGEGARAPGREGCGRGGPWRGSAASADAWRPGGVPGCAPSRVAAQRARTAACHQPAGKEAQMGRGGGNARLHSLQCREGAESRRSPGTRSLLSEGSWLRAPPGRGRKGAVGGGSRETRGQRWTEQRPQREVAAVPRGKGPAARNLPTVAPREVGLGLLHPNISEASLAEGRGFVP